MSDTVADSSNDALLQRIALLEARLQDSEETLGAIRRGEVDALVVGGQPEEHQVYTLDSADRPYRVLIEQIQEGAVTLMPDGTVLYCNRRVADLLGVAQERVIGQSLRSYASPDQQEGLDQVLEAARSMRSRHEILLRTKAGTVVPVLLSLSPLDSHDGTTLLCGVLTDLTEQKNRLRELGEAYARLESEIGERERVEEALRQSQKMEAVGQLTGGLAHDFNNLLTGITGALELLTTRIGQQRFGEVGRYVEAAQGAARRAAALTHRLLAFSRRQTLASEPTRGDRLVNGIMELIQRTVGPSIAVEVAAAEPLWVAMCDPNQLENAVLNLCINARDAMPDGGRITIDLANVTIENNQVAARDMPPGAYVAVSISDTGTGMPPDVVARAFDPFFTTKPIGMGTGLGLSMVYGFANQSGGQVRIHSVEGVGTTVSVYLPRHLGDEHGVATQLPAVETPRARHGETVLVVDDEPTVRMLVAEVLHDLGYIAIEAEDGAAGLRALQTGARIDLLVTDVGLPGGMNGRQLADAARVMRTGLKILFITGYAENAVLSHGDLDPGMHVLTKPFGMDALAKRIRTLISG